MTTLNKVQLYYSTLSPPCWSVWLVCEELGIDYEEHTFMLDKGEHRIEEYKAINHRQKVPCIQDGDFKMGESRAIIEYLCDKYGTGNLTKLFPKDTTQRTLINQVLWFDYDAYIAISEFVGAIPLLYKQVIPDLSNTSELDKHLEHYEYLLQKNEYMAGDHMTVCDICALCSLCVLEVPEKDFFGGFPKTKAWMTKMKSELKSFEKCVGIHLKGFASFYRSACAQK